MPRPKIGVGLSTFMNLLVVQKGPCWLTYTTVGQFHHFSDNTFPETTWQPWPGHFCPPPPSTIKEYFEKWL